MKKILNSNWMPWNSWPSMGVLIIALIVGLTIACQHTALSFDEENGVTRLPTGQRIYETVYKGKTYIIVETHRGVGICEK